MEKIEETMSQEVHVRSEGLTNLFKALSNPDAFRLFLHTSDGIKNSTYAIEELAITPKRYYSRLKELTDIGLVRKYESAYRQTALGRMIYDHFLPAMRKAVDAREELEFLVGLEGIEIENGVKNYILEELGIPDFAVSTKVKMLGDYEALAIAAIDTYDSAENSVLFASNYLDVRVMEATFRSTERGVTNRLIIGKRSIESKLQNLRMMLSLTFAKTIINFASSKVNLQEFVRFADLPYSFCVVDGQYCLIELSNPLNDSFIAALSIKDRDVGEKLTKFHEMLWKAGEPHSAFKVLDLINYN